MRNERLPLPSPELLRGADRVDWSNAPLAQMYPLIDVKDPASKTKEREMRKVLYGN